MRLTIVAGFLLCATTNVAAEPLRRVRVTDPVLERFIESGRERSATFRVLRELLRR